jgi:hypothetical protein
MMDVDKIECAAGLWLRRLHGQTKLPPSGTLEMLRRREVSARKRAEDHADAERRCSALAQERLLDEQRLSVWREESVVEAQQALETERRLRLSAEVALAQAAEEKRRAESESSIQIKLRKDAERREEAAKQEVLELRALIDDDASLTILDDFSMKLEAQRNEIVSLQDCLELVREEAAATAKVLQAVRVDFEQAQKQWAADRGVMMQQQQDLVSKCRLLAQDNKSLRAENRRLGDDMDDLRQAGDTLQAVAEATLEACTAPPVHIVELEALRTEPVVATINHMEVTAAAVYEQELLSAMMGAGDFKETDFQCPWLVGSLEALGLHGNLAPAEYPEDMCWGMPAQVA